MIREARGFGEDVNEARENAIKELGADITDDVQFEIISTAKKKVLGIFGGCKAEVRAFIELPEVKKPQKKAKKPLSEQKDADKKKKSPEVKADAPAKENMIRDPFEDAVDVSLIPEGSPALEAVEYLKKIFAGLGCEISSIKVAAKENAAYILVDGENVGTVIGHRGETLDAVQYLASLAVDNGGKYYRVSVNVGDYREKREQMLTSLAKRIANQVLKTGRGRRLEPMNPYERRIIHTAVQAIDGVVSSSVGEGDSRRVVIYPENGEMPKERVYSSERRSSRPRRNNNSVKADPDREPKRDTDIPLYGKIN